MNADIDETALHNKRLILDAARNRFLKFGFTKTTMAEIAKDCQMSASNIYRFFSNKLDLAAKLTCAYLADELAVLQAVVANEKLTATERLQAFVFTLFDKTYSTRREQPRIIETVITICNERQDIVDDHIKQKHALLVDLLQQGVANGEFVVKDIAVSAEAISTALALFNGPLYMPLYTREIFEAKAEGLLELILYGLKNNSSV